MRKIKKLICLIIILTMALSLGLTANAKDYKYNMSYIYYGNADYFAQQVDDTNSSMNEVAPDYFSLDSSGNLVITTDTSASFVQNMHSGGVLVSPYLTNDWDQAKGITALNNADKLSSDIAAAVTKYNLDGINIDIENVTPNERSAYVNFAKLLREKLGSGKVISVEVAANPYGTKTGWAGSYDYAGLAQYCDYLMIMAYDESYYGSAPGPVASIVAVEKSLKYALSVVSKDKIVLGLPFYGRMWSSDGGAPNGYGVSNSTIESLIKNYSGTVTVDSVSQAACATITVRDTDTKPIIAGKALAAGTYVIWYSNEQSIKAELALVTKYDIKGSGSWSLGQEAEDTWDYYKLWLNGCTFDDIQNSWAKDYILTAFMNNWMEGISSDSFAPDASMTRAQAAAILVRLLKLTPDTGSSSGFDDCKGNWAESYINTARAHNIVSGVGENKFSPDSPVTREELALMLNNVLGYTGSSSATVFNDVSKENNSWSYDAISALSEQNIITGYSDGSFKPGNDVTRAEMTAMIARIDAAKLKSTTV